MKKKYFISLILLTLIMFPNNILATSEIETKLDTILSNIENSQQSIFLKNHPVGSIYITTNNDESTTSKMTSKYGGTWKVYADGKTLAGYNSNDTDYSTINKTGGVKSITLSTSNIPSHTHSISHTHGFAASSISSSGAHTHATTASSTSTMSLTAQNAGSHSHSFSSGGLPLSTIGAENIITGFGYSNGSLWSGHNHGYSDSLQEAGSHTHSVTGSITVPALSISSSGAHTHTVPSTTTGGSSAANSGATGSGTAFTNLEPYIVAYIYERTA